MVPRPERRCTGRPPDPGATPVRYSDHRRHGLWRRRLRDSLSPAPESRAPAHIRTTQGSDAAVVEREGHAAMSARHLSEARDRIERQRELIDHLRRSGLPTARSETLLKLFEDILSSMLVHDAIIRRGARG